MEFLAEFHPRVVHFPIALLLTYVLFESLGAITKKEFLLKGAHLILLLGVIGAFAAVQTGERAEDAFEYWNKEASALMEIHEQYANITIWYFAVLLVIRTFLVFKKKFTNVFKYAFMVLAIVGAYFIYQTGDHGGRMVYEHGIGTKYKINVMEDY
ncbi:MAG: DUF2231 domain-containing protein [Ignavibacteriales bacterium]|nr:MAG: DUF2231 domain-containing protein [Ignavibacteriales bacterium]